MHLEILTTTLAISLMVAAAATAHPEHGDQPATSEPAATVDAFHHALAAGEAETALGLLTPDAVIFESGGAEMSPEEYAHHHLGADMAFSAATRTEVVDRRVQKSGDAAWVLTRSETRGRFRDRDIASRGIETMVLVRGADGWRIAHVHWSSSPIEEE